MFCLSFLPSLPFTLFYFFLRSVSTLVLITHCNLFLSYSHTFAHIVIVLVIRFSLTYFSLFRSPMVLSQAFNQLANPNTVNNRRRRLFIPPSTQFPLFSYGREPDQRSFLSLDESGSVYTGTDVDDVVSVASSRSLPSTLSSAHTSEDQESFHSWLVEEHQRRYNATESDSDEQLLESRSVGSRSSASHYSDKTFQSVFEQEDFASLKTTYTRELKMLVRYSAPLVITFVLEHFFSIVCLLVVGHLGKDELAAVSLASMTSTITFAIFEGIATALDTLCPQAYGAGNYELVSTHVQRCFVFSLVVYLPCALMWWNSNLLLQFVISSPKVLELTTQFLRILILGGPAYIFFENFKRFLQAQGIFEAGTGVLFVSAPINIFLSWFLVWDSKYGIGYVGAPIATAINFWIMAILLVLYATFVDGSRCWYGFCSPKELFSKWGQLSHLALPGIVMLESEYLAYELMTLFASYFGTTQLAAQSAVGSIASLTYMVPFALSIASSTRIANFIGGQNIYSAQIATRVGLMCGLCLAVANCLVLFTFRWQIARLFSKDDEVILLIVQLLAPLVSVLQIFDGVASVASGILRAQGSQKIGGIINFLSYYAFAMPLAFVLCTYTDLELKGLWLGVGSGMVLIGLTETIVILNSDWESIIVHAGLMNYAEEE
ncbi:MATE efflux family protein [Clavispora lusitaniae]|uniref:MATE efflux family protein n=1 Tax=Clavispora lusitaniae TaxID=36911 RepID=UPI00202BCED0|nr:MATE efflux family protein [Clavispora lusitaniae]